MTRLRPTEAYARASRAGGSSRYRYVRLRWRVAIGFFDLVGAILAGAMRLLWRRRAASVEPTVVPRKVLVIQLDHLGDTVLSLELLALLRCGLPHTRIDVLCGAAGAELLEACPDVDCVKVLENTRFARPRRATWPLSLVGCAWRLRREGYDWGIDVRGELPHVLLMCLAGIPRRIGWSCGGGGFLLTASPEWIADRHESQSRRALAAAVLTPDMHEAGIAAAQRSGEVPAGQSTLDSSDQTPRENRFEPSLPAREMVAGLLRGFAVSDRPLIAIHVAAGTPAKRWPLVQWQRLAWLLDGLLEARVVIVQAELDATSPEERQAFAWPENVLDLSGRLGVVELAALFAQVDLLVSADSGPAHLAAAVGTPVVVLFSGTNDPAIWQPVGAPVQIVRNRVPCAPCRQTQCSLADHPCMTSIEPWQVLDKVGGLLAARHQPRPNSAGLFANTDANTAAETTDKPWSPAAWAARPSTDASSVARQAARRRSKACLAVELGNGARR